MLGDTATEQDNRQGSAGALDRVRAYLYTNQGSIMTVVLCALAIWAVSEWAETARQIRLLYIPLPTDDYWRVPQYFHFYRKFDLRVLWMQHNEHRIVFPEMVFAADMLGFHGRAIFVLVVSFACYAGTALVLMRAFFTERSLSRACRCSGILIAAAVIGWKGSAFVLAEPFLLQWTAMQLAVVLSLAFLVRTKYATHSRLPVASIVSAVVATYCVGNGLLLWPVLVCAGFALRLRRRQIASICIAGVLASGIYFLGYRFSGASGFRVCLSHPFYTVGFVASYLAMPFGGMKSPAFGVYVGLASLAAAGSLFAFAARRRLLREPLAVLLFGLYTFTLLTAILTGIGRLDPFDGHFADAKAIRYVAVPLVNWAALILLSLWVSSRGGWRIGTPPAIAIVSILLTAVGFAKLRFWLEENQEPVAEQQWGTLAIESGLSDNQFLLKVFPDAGFVRAVLPVLKQNHLSIYYEGRTKWLGQPVSNYPLPLGYGGSGAVTYVARVPSGIEVAGWSDESNRRTAAEWLLFANEQNQIVGFGRRLNSGVPKSLRAATIPPSLAWGGFINLAYPVRSFSAYLIEPRALVPLPGGVDVQVSDAGVGREGEF